MTKHAIQGAFARTDITKTKFILQITRASSFTLRKGGGMKWYQKVCDTCGNCVSVPRNAPENFDITMDGGAVLRMKVDHHIFDKLGDAS